MLNRVSILVAWAVAVVLGSVLVSLALEGGDVFGIALAFASGASLPYLGAYLVLAPRMTSFARQQGLHLGLAALTLLGLLPFLGGWALFMVPYLVIGVVCHVLLRRARPAAAQPAPDGTAA
jgi:hypothetical protein